MATRPKRATTGRSPRTLLLWGLLAVAVLAVGYAAFFLDADTGPSVDEVAGAPEVTGDPLPTLEDPATDPAVGSAAPVATGAGFDGQGEVTIGDEGAELVVFLASWCPACQAEVPEIVAWAEAGGLPDDVELSAVVTLLDANRPNWPPQDWLEREAWTHPVLVDDADGSVAQAYGLSGTPFTVAMRDGEVVARVSGQIPQEGLSQLAAAVSGG